MLDNSITDYQKKYNNCYNIQLSYWKLYKKRTSSKKGLSGHYYNNTVPRSLQGYMKTIVRYMSMNNGGHQVKVGTRVGRRRFVGLGTA